MQTVKKVLGASARLVKANSPEILTAAAGVGVITTAYLTGQAAWKSQYVINDPNIDTPYDRRKALIHNAKQVWKLYIPAGVSAVATIGCIVGAQRSEGKKTLAATTALSVTERAYSQYRDKVIEEFGDRKDQSIRDQIVADEIKRNPPSEQLVLTSEPGRVLCCELFTGRYFLSDMETLRKAQNDLNAELLAGTYATLDTFYDMIRLDYTKASGNMGWTCDRQMELKFSTHLHDGKPCLAFDYNYIKSL